jgi:hypothetical protein
LALGSRDCHPSQPMSRGGRSWLGLPNFPSQDPELQESRCLVMLDCPQVTQPAYADCAGLSHTGLFGPGWIDHPGLDPGPVQAGARWVPGKVIICTHQVLGARFRKAA